MAGRSTRQSFLAAALVTCVLLGRSAAQPTRGRGDDRRAWVFTGDQIPEPPQQRQPWSPVRTPLPAAFVSAAVTLFHQGLADPRGCEYRIVKLASGDSASGYRRIETTHGWALPAAAGDSRRFVALWDGLVYPALEVGAAVDLRRDIRLALEAEAKARPGRHWNPAFRSFNGILNGNSSFRRFIIRPLAACLLLRLGEGQLARRISDAAGREYADEDPYMELAQAWVWALFDRAVYAYMSGDDALALLSARALVPIGKSVQVESARRGIRQERWGRENFDFLEPLPELLADQERRASQARRDLVLHVGLGRYSDQQARIAALIQDLENAGVRQFSQPGAPDFRQEPIVAALIGEGEAAVEPLVDCMENDSRLTRAVGYWRDFDRHRYLCRVHEAADVALEGILHVSPVERVISDGSPAQIRRAAAARWRAYWVRYQNLRPTERWYRTLLDDGAGARMWLQAAGNIVNPEGQLFGPGWAPASDWSRAAFREGGRPPRLQGEELRAKTGPAVGQLMAKRARDLSRLAASADPKARGDDASDMMLQLAVWDARAAVPMLRAEMRRRLVIVRSHRGEESFDVDNDAHYLAHLAVARARGGDLGALADYARWVRTLRPNFASFRIEESLEPLWRYPHRPEMARAAVWLFNDPRSPWAASKGKRGGAVLRALEELTRTPMLGAPGFRKRILRELRIGRRAGTVEIKDEMLNLSLDGNWGEGRSYFRRDPLAPRPGQKRVFRVCDLIAWHLSQIDGAPEYEPYWPVVRRDAAVAAIDGFLRRYGDRVRFTAQQARLSSGSWDPQAVLIFPRLERPASAVDIRQVRAVFSLAAPMRSRVYRLPSYPIRARWVTLKKYPEEHSAYDEETGRRSRVHGYEHDGYVWQAEELLRNGRWRRFYGFVGSHEVARVPAEAIEFPAREEWKPLTHQLDCRLTLPARAAPAALYELPPLFEAGRPLVATVWLRNRSGTNHRVPGLYEEVGPEGPALRAGIEPRLLYSPVSPQVGPWPGLSGETTPKWQEVPLTSHLRFTSGDAGRMLAPGEEFAALNLDLTRWFGLQPPGFYRLRVTFGTRPSGFAEGRSKEVEFELGLWAPAEERRPAVGER
jgi:hypothetical protein